MAFRDMVSLDRIFNVSVGLDNYFKVGTMAFGFRLQDYASTRMAFDAARAYAGGRNAIVMWKVPKHPGPWDECDLVYHRPRKAIAQSITFAEQALDIAAGLEAIEELHALEYEWKRVGRGMPRYPID